MPNGRTAYTFQYRVTFDGIPLTVTGVPERILIAAQESAN
jgi:hypothetical protein